MKRQKFEWLLFLVFALVGCGGNGDSGGGGTTPPSALTGVTAIAGGGYHTIALKSDGTVWAWGLNSVGQLGDGTMINRTIPVQVSGLTGVTAIAGGLFHTIALKNDGTVWVWGGNYAGQLGDGTTTDRNTPVQVIGLTGVTAIAGGFEHSIALKSDETVWAWGDNSQGQLGDGTITGPQTCGSDAPCSTTPVQVSGLTGVTAIAGGVWHTIVLKNDGTVWAWGRNDLGQLGDVTNPEPQRCFSGFLCRTTPIQMSGLTGVTAIAGGAGHTITLKNDGTVWAWGYNYSSGQLGDGTTTDRYIPVQVIGLTGVTAIAAGYYHTIALKSDGTVWAWGDNSFGQLGDGTNTGPQTCVNSGTPCSTTPVQVIGLTGVTAIAARYHHTIALKNDETVWAWGHNISGQLGDGTTTDRYNPVQVSGP
jgi:alpha-tubulin suppressor-like RCC1 family protein